MATQAKTIEEITSGLSALFPLSAIEWKPQTIKKDKTKALAVPYIDARDIAERLDAVVGSFGWQRLHQGDAVGIGIQNPETGEWIWKYDVGFVVGENSDKEDAQIKGIKGTASDGFKRAAYLWNIGRYLYKFPKQWLDWDDEARRFKQQAQFPAWAIPQGENKPAPTAQTTNGNGNGNGGQPKMSDVQRAKLIDLYLEIHGGERNDAVKALDKLFLDQFKHGGKDATYEDATKLTAQLLAEQKSKTDTKTKAKK